MNTLRRAHVISPSGRAHRLLGPPATTRKRALSPGQRPRSARSRLRLVAAAALALVLAAAAAVPAAASDGTDPPPPAVPTGLAAAVSHDAVTLSWDDPGDDTISGYVILRRDKAIHPQGTFETVATNTATADTAYVDLNVRAGRRYVYRIQAINPAGTSDRSSWARAYTPGPRPSPHRPARPTGLSSQASHDTVTLSWDDPGDPAVSGYVILRRDKDVHNRGTFHTINPDTGDADTTYTDATAEPERRYIYRIKAINTAGYSKTSAYHRTDTPPAPEPAPEPDPTQDTTDTDPATDTDTHPDDNDADAADTHPDDNDADADTTTLTPPAHTPRWVQGLVAAYTTHGSTDNSRLPAPTNYQISTLSDFEPGDKVPIGLTLRWDSVADAEGYEIYILATREINGVERDWWVVPSDEGDEISLLNESDQFGKHSAILTVIGAGDTPSFAPDHLIIAVSAYSETPGTPSESGWRVAVLNFAEETVSYDIYDEFD